MSTHKVENLFVLKESLEQINKIESIVLNIRYDPNLVQATSFDPRFIAESANSFFLVSKHYFQLEILLELLKFEWTIDFADFLAALSDYVAKYLPSQKCHELVVELRKDGTSQIDSLQLDFRENLFCGVFGRSDVVFQVFMDTEFTAKSPLTTFSVGGSRPLERAAKRMQTLSDNAKIDSDFPQEILLISPGAGVMSGITCNYAFFRNEQWITPSIANGARFDPLREALLDVSFLKEGEVQAQDVMLHEEILVFNSVLGVTRGVITSLNAEFKPNKKRGNRNQAKAKERRQKAQARQEEEYRARQASALLDQTYEFSEKKFRALPPGSSIFKLQ